jgi:type IV pilus assembly protein PilF
VLRAAGPLLALLISLAACAPAAPKRNLEPQAPGNEVAVANLNLGIEYMRRGEYERALEKLDKARQADPSYAFTYNTYGVLYQQLGDTARAEQNFKKALQLAPGNSSTLNNYGRFLCQRGRQEEALKAFAEAAANPLYETPEIPIANSGSCALGAGKTAEAEQFFRRALEINPNLANALLQMAGLSFSQNKFLPARGYLQRYIAVAPHTAESLWLGIRIEQQLGDRNAVSSYALLLRNQFPESEESRQLRESGIK